MYTFTYMARPKKLDALTTSLSARIRPEQDYWLRWVADNRFEGEISRAVRWALDQAQVFDQILRDPDPVHALDEMLNPREPIHPEEEVIEAERELAAWQHEQAIKRAQRKARESK
jgi:hypothetical protein